MRGGVGVATTRAGVEGLDVMARASASFGEQQFELWPKTQLRHNVTRDSALVVLSACPCTDELRKERLQECGRRESEAGSPGPRGAWRSSGEGSTWQGRVSCIAGRVRLFLYSR